jgi:RecA/RadA recombinase
MLVKLSEEYSEDSAGFNVSFVIDESERYCKRRELELRSNAVRVLLDDDKVDEAEELVLTYNEIAKATSGWTNPLAPTSIGDVFRDDHQDYVLSMPGQMGQLLGRLERGWLLSVFGPFKRGKTWWMIEFATMGLLSGAKVSFSSLEMKEKDINQRIYRRLTAYGEGGARMYPAFDCLLNQTGECDLPYRVNNITLRDNGGNKPDFHPEMKYRVCTECRGVREDYQPNTWFEMIERPAFTLGNIKKRIDEFKESYGDNIRAKYYPKFSANIKDIERDLDLLHKTEDFIPDLIVIDYASALAPEDRREIGVQRADTTWKTMAGLAGKRHALVVTGSQGTRASIYTKDLRQDDLAEWIGQLAHVDITIGLNQTMEEKREGVMRIGLNVHRHRDFHEDEYAHVLQNIPLGQVHLASQEWRE